MASRNARAVDLTDRILADVGPHPRLAKSGRVGHRIALDEEPFICVSWVRADGRSNVQLWANARLGMGPLPPGVVRVGAPDHRHPDPDYHSFEMVEDVALTFTARRIRSVLGLDEPDVGERFEREVASLLKTGQVPRPPPRSGPAATVDASRREFVRDPRVKAWVLQQANGRCERCSSPAPFVLPSGLPYLEVHHVHRLADGGSDTVENAVALCPNCHRLLHLARDAEVQRGALTSRVARFRPTTEG